MSEQSLVTALKRKIESNVLATEEYDQTELARLKRIAKTINAKETLNGLLDIQHRKKFSHLICVKRIATLEMGFTFLGAKELSWEQKTRHYAYRPPEDTILRQIVDSKRQDVITYIRAYSMQHYPNPIPNQVLLHAERAREEGIKTFEVWAVETRKVIQDPLLMGITHSGSKQAFIISMWGSDLELVINSKGKQ